MNKKGKLIVIEGTDGSGKQTQSEMLFKRFQKEGIPSLLIHFPDYSSPSSALVKMYLNGDFGNKPDDVNPFIASTFYACDRFASYRQKWQSLYEDGWVIISDRYTTSNMIHQGVKFESFQNAQDFIHWLEDFEYRIFQIPKPDQVIFLDMPPQQAQALMATRVNKITGTNEKDIHEKDVAYLLRSYKASLEIAKSQGWISVPCTNEKGIKSIEEISDIIWSIQLGGNS